MTTTLKYVGKKTTFVGKTLWEIIGNLKDFGIGRVVIRNTHLERYKEPSYLRILEVKAHPNVVPPAIKVLRPPNDLRDRDRPRKVEVLCEYVFRGVKYDQPKLIIDDSVFADYVLIPKPLETNYTFTKTSEECIEENILPREADLPPLLREILIKNGVKDPKLIVQCLKNDNVLYRIAKVGEKSTRQFKNGFGIPKSPNLYKGINYDI